MSAVHGKGISAAVAAVLCATPAPAQTVTVNYGYSSVKMACREEFTKRDPERNFACLDWEVNFRDLVSRLDAQFAANPLCHGIYFTQPGEENLPEQYWALWLYPAPGQDRQSWILFKYGIGMKSDFRGDGLPQEIAREVCAASRGARPVFPGYALRGRALRRARLRTGRIDPKGVIRFRRPEERLLPLKRPCQ